ncbi:MAG TPA: hypothetical protein VH374_21820 [Polyangia bacterium]|jgi:hypothetical protein|nr:hypothetical protein [Polyangia bacterium]
MKSAALAIVLVCLPVAALAVEPACLDAAGRRFDPRGTGPLPAGDSPADFGQVPEACPGLDVLARLRSTLLVASDYPDYYGNVTVSALVRLRYPLTARMWMSVGLDVVTFRYVANAVVRSHAFDVGPPTVGVFRDVGHVGPGALAIYARLLLPIDSARTNGVLLGGEAGVSYWRLLRSRFAIQGGVAAPMPVTVIAGQAHGAFRPAAVVEATWRAGRAAALVIGAAGHLQAMPDPGLLSLAARAGLRLVLARGMNAALMGEIPFAGSDRTSAIASLFVGWTPSQP